MATQADVRRIALSFPDVEEGADHFAFSVPNKGKLKGFVWVWMERVTPKKPRVANPGVIAARVANVGQRDLMIAAEPKKFFTEPHYAGFPAVLVRLDAVSVADLKVLIAEAWRCQAPTEPAARKKTGGSAMTAQIPTDVGVAPGYRHAPKYVTPGEPLELTGTSLKWYSLSAADRPVPDSIASLARGQLGIATLEARGFGFVILHRCGNDFYFLLISTWRNENELWETVWYKNGDAMAEFALFPRDGEHKPTFCVWELAPVWHEAQAWTRFISSARDASAAQAWLRDRYVGQA